VVVGQQLDLVLACCRRCCLAAAEGREVADRWLGTAAIIASIGSSYPGVCTHL
jgi:hypothetical protein